MSKLKSTEDIPILIINETIDSFFERGRNTAKLLDQNRLVSPRRVISFEDIHDLVKFLTENKINLIATVRKRPNSITALAKILKRSRAAVNKDIQLLESLGIVKSEYVANPGHGRCRMVFAIDKTPITLQVQTII